MRNFSIKRFTASLLLIVMLISVIPLNVFADVYDTAYGDFTGNTIRDTAVIFSDLHTSSSDYKQSTVSGIMGALKTAGLPVSSVTSAGDAFSVNSTEYTGYTSTITGSIRTALGNNILPVNYVWSDHDRCALQEDGKTLLDKTSHLVYGAGNDGVYGTSDDDNYYVYVLSMADTSSNDRYRAGFNYTATNHTNRENAGFTATVELAIENFKNDVKDLDKSKPLLIVGHQPLLNRRGDNAWAEDWVAAINEVAVSMDVAYFFGHNHNHDKAEDYYYAKGSEMPVPKKSDWNWAYNTGYQSTVSMASVSTEINFTHLCAGYMAPSSTGSTSTTTRQGTVMAVTITNSNIQFVTYNKSGIYTGSYAVNETISREHANANIPKNVAVTGKIDYQVGDAIKAPSSVKVTYMDGSVKDLTDGYSLTKIAKGTTEYSIDGFTFSEEGTYTLTYTCNVGTYQAQAALTVIVEGKEPEKEISSISADGTKNYTVGDNLSFKVTVTYTDGSSKTVTMDECELNWNCADHTACANAEAAMNKTASHQVAISYGGKSTTFDFTVRKADRLTGNADGVAVSISSNVVGSITAETSANAFVANAMATLGVNNYLAYDITPAKELKSGNRAGVYLPLPEGANNVVVYYVSPDGETVTDMKATVVDGEAFFITDHFSTFVVGDVTEITVPDPETATGTGSTTKNVYKLATSISANKAYLIVNGNAAGDYYALARNGSSVSATPVTIKTDNGTYIELADATDELWTTSARINSSTSSTLKNGNYYLYAGSSGTLDLDDSTGNYTNWRLNSNKLYRYRRNNTSYYLRYSSNSWTTTSSSSSGTSVYFYEAATITVSNDGTYSIAGDPAEIIKVVKNGSTLQLGSIMTFTPANGGTVTTTDTSATATYSVVDGGDPNGIISGITGNTVTFSGKAGKALVKVSYKTDFGTVTNYIQIQAAEPTYRATISYNDKVVSGTTVSLKEVTATTTMQLSSNATLTTADGTEDCEGTYVWSIPAEYQHIATVDENGLVSFKGVDGAFYVTVTFTEKATGKIVTTGVNVSAHTGKYSTPTDGTNDFPEYPDPGSVRFDKTATSVGNFSETGIVQVELSMSGVPFSSPKTLDVVLMLDHSNSMTEARMAATRAAVKLFIKNIVTNEDGTFNNNRIYVGSFAGGNPDPQYAGQDRHKFRIYDITQSEEDGYQIIDTQAELEALIGTIDANGAIGNDGAVDDIYYKFSSSTAPYGTEYDQSLQKCYELLSDTKADGNQQFCVFMSDGIPNVYRYGEGASDITTSSSAMAALFANSGTDKYATRGTNYQYEYWSSKMKQDGVTVFTVGLGLNGTNSSLSGADEAECERVSNMLLNDISGPAGETADQRDTGDTVSKLDEYFFSVADSNAASGMADVFGNISSKILDAASNVVATDKIGEDYTMIFDIPIDPSGSHDISEHLPDGKNQEFYIEVLKYALDAAHERTGEKESLCKLYLGKSNGAYFAAKDAAGNAFEAPEFATAAEGKKAYWTIVDANYTPNANDIVITINGTYYRFMEEGNGTHNMISGAYAYGTTDANNLSTNLVIVTPHFAYSAAREMLAWTADKLVDTHELALSYFLYLEGSSTAVGQEGVEKTPGAYETNQWAYITYTNHLGNECRQEFPVPQMTWNGAQVSYVFYLVNENGQPINKSGQVVDFANATFITQVYTDSVVWNDMSNEGTKELNVQYVARDKLPSDYLLYDDNASYAIHVFENEKGEDLFNYFIISGSTLGSIGQNGHKINNINTTKVYNTKSGDKYFEYGIYSAHPAKTSFETTDAAGNSITITTTKHASLNYAATTVAFAVVWQPKLVEDTVVVDFGLDVLINVTLNDNLLNTITGIGLSKSVYGTTAINTGLSPTSKLSNQPIDTPNFTISIVNDNQIRFRQKNMLFDEAVVFYYETTAKYTEDSQPKSGYMYSKVTIIPATNIYYEESFVTFTNAKALDENGNIVTDSEGKETYVMSGVGAWENVDDGTKVEGVQDEDRPGNNITSIDHNNVYGYDPAYKSYKIFSLGTAKWVSVNSAVGNHRNNSPTASFTFTGTGFDIISMTNSDSGVIFITATKRGTNESTNKFVDNYYGYTYTEANGWTPAPDPNAAIYQVPVMKISDLDYGTYDVTIWVTYNEHFDHDGKEGYSFWLDSIRIYDPAGTDFGDDSVIGDAYDKDGESNPSYLVIGDAILPADSDFTNETLPGAVFIDGKQSTNSAADYAGPGPNNEIYLYPGQAIAFMLSSEATPLDIQIGVKLAFGDSADVVFAFSANSTNIRKITTATDMYYSIGSYLNLDSDDQQSETAIEWYSDSITVMNNSTTGAVISLTNIKATFKMASYGDDAADINGEPGTPATITLITDAEVIEDAAAVVTKFFAFKPVVKPVLEVFDPETLAYTVVSGIRGINTVRVITSNDADAITVNGIEATKTDNSKIIKSMVKMLDKLYGDKHNADDYCVWTVEVKSAPVYDIVAFQIVEIPDTSIDAPVAFEPETVAHTVISNINGTNTVRVITSKDVSSIIVNGVKAEKINDAKILKSMVKMLDKLYDDKHNESDYYVWTVDVKSAASYDIVAFNEDGVSTIPAIENTKNVSNK